MPGVDGSVAVLPDVHPYPRRNRAGHVAEAGHHLQQASTGAAVKAAQAELNAHGVALTVDGDFGVLTASAVKTYQTSHRLPANGIVGTDTSQSLVS